METQAGRVTAKSVLNASNFDNYMYPSRYNDEREMTRFFSFQFIDGCEISDDVDWNVKSETIQSDGVIYGIIPHSEAQLKEISGIVKKTSKSYDRFIFVLPKHFQAIDGVIREYAAVKQLRDQAANDLVLFDEYEVVFEDLQEVINGFISSYTHPESYRSVYYHDGEIKNVHRKSGLTEVMSQICDRVFGLTPIINNESVNKNEITSIAANSRNKIISALLRNELEPNLGLSGTGQEVSIMRSTLLRTGIWCEEGGIAQLNLHPADAAMRNMLETIENFVLEARQNGRISFSVLYDRLTSPNNHIGLRNGLIPIYVAVVMHNYRQQVVINDRFGPVQTSVDVLVQINSEPSSFSIEYLDWNPEKEDYIARLAMVFGDYVVEADKAGSSYDYVANAMRRWYMARPKFSKECKVRPYGIKIGKRQQEMIKLLRANSSGSDLLFKKLPTTFAYDDFTADAAGDIVSAKTIYDGLLNELKKHLIEETKLCFLPKEDKESGKKATLTAIVKEWCESLDPKSFEQLFSDGTERFLQHLRSATNDEDLFITRLAKLATGLRIEDWDGQTEKAYFAALVKYMQTAKEFHDTAVAETINETSSYQVTFADEDGKKTVRRFDKVEVSARGKLLFNQITASLDAMGHSISEQEKRQILMEVIKKLC